MTKLSMWTRRRNRKVTLFKKTDNKKHMKKFERAEFIMEHLEMIYPNTPIPLNHKSIFELLIAVLLSAQCTDERVNKVTPHLFNSLKDLKKCKE